MSFIENRSFRDALSKYLEFLFEQKMELDGILLFGSVARGDARDDEDHESDIDLIVVSDDLPVDFDERLEFTSKLTEPVNAGIQEIWWTRGETEQHVKSKYFLALDAFDEGKILYDPNNFLEELKRELARELADRGVKKTNLYWQWPIAKFGDRVDF
ncbi:MAG: nucleotidyltransferase domain-containing protein [Promethearchaeota archaeon]